MYKPENLRSAEEKIRQLDDQIFKLESAKQIALRRVTDLMEEHGAKKKKERQAEAPVQILEFPKGATVRQLNFVKDNKKFHFDYHGFAGEEMPVTTTDILADLRQGIFYELNHEIVSQEHNKKYNLFRRKYIEVYYNWQISQLRIQKQLIQRLEIDNVARQDMQLARAYEAIRDEAKEKKAGFVFEQMITGILQKVAWDLGEAWGLEFEDADVIDDVELKTDCLIKIKKRNRGVGVEESQQIQGIQLTLKKAGDPDFERKKAQVAKINKNHGGGKRRIDDLVLIEVGVGNKEIMETWRAWEVHDKAPGGPEKFFRVSRIINDFLNKIFEDTELDLNKNEEFRKDLWKYFEENGYGKA